MRLRLNGTGNLAAGGRVFALRCADNVLRGTDRRRPEARALAAWLDRHRDRMHVPDGEDFCPGKEDHTALPALAWCRLRTAVTRLLRPVPAAAEPAVEALVRALGERLHLDEVERDLLRLVMFYRTDAYVEDLVDRLNQAQGGNRFLPYDPALLALLLDRAPDAVGQALRPAGRLFGYGLLHVEDGSRLVLHDQVAMQIRCTLVPGTDPFGALLGPVLPASLPPDAFAHIGPLAAIASDLVRAALHRREPGINLLLYGPPGTGKTSFAATLAAQAGAQLHAVTEQDNNGQEPTRLERLTGLQLAQRLAPPGETILLFDEAEDGFVRSSAPGGSVPPSRVFMHRLLERTPVPVIWTANDIGTLGPAALRRMTLCVEMKVPGIAVRTRLWRNLAAREGLALPEAEAARLAHLVPAAPAVAATALRATRLVGGDASTARVIVEGIARAVAGRQPPHAAAKVPPVYDPALLNANTDLPALAVRLCRAGSPQAVSLLLSGPPGTGKSAWVRHLAARMGLTVLCKRGSDLFGPYVGQTEAAIAAAFAEARADGAFLVFDEADSLLAERGDAVRSWEVSQVNEMLTGLERHALPFACTTNLPDRLDRASLRRFLVKVALDWMTPSQARLAFRRFFGIAAPAALDDLRTLTPADFDLVRRRAALTGAEQDAGTLLHLLAAECAGRIGGRVRVGFSG